MIKKTIWENKSEVLSLTPGEGIFIETTKTNQPKLSIKHIEDLVVGSYTNASLIVNEEGRITSIQSGSPIETGLVSISSGPDHTINITGHQSVAPVIELTEIHSDTVTVPFPSNLEYDKYGRIVSTAGGSQYVETVTSDDTTNIVVSGEPHNPKINLAETSFGADSVFYPTNITWDKYGRVIASTPGTQDVASITSGDNTAIAITGTTVAPVINLAELITPNVIGYPTSVSLDKYGRITEIEEGEEPLIDVFSANNSNIVVTSTTNSSREAEIDLAVVGTAGSAAFPSNIVWDNYGRVTSVTEGTNSIKSVTGQTGRIISSTTSNNVSIDLDLAGTSGTYSYPTSVTTDAYGRITNVVPGTDSIKSVSGQSGSIIASTTNNNVSLDLDLAGVSGTYTHPASVTTDVHGRVTNVVAGTESIKSVSGSAGRINAATLSGAVSVDLSSAGTSGTYTYPSSITTDNYGRVTNVVQGAAGGSLPIGTIILWGGQTLPDSNWAECAGQTVSRTVYANLFAAYGTTWGSGDGTSTFNLPDTRGMFPRGWNNTKSSGFFDPNAATRTASNAGGVTGDKVGTVQGHDLTAHSHTYFMPGGNTEVGSTNAQTVSNPRSNSTTGIFPTTGGLETRPVNFSIMFIIKVL